MIPCLSLSRCALESSFLQKIQIKQNILLGTSENLQALER